MANIITCCRILCSVLILFFPAFSPWFYTLYLISGFTDMIDGTVARKTNTVSEFGSRLDTAADLILVAVCFIKLMPVINLPGWLWTWVAVIAVIKVISIVYGSISYKKLVSEHTIMNKVTGLLLFVLPLTLEFVKSQYSTAVVCTIATFAAIEEFYIMRKGRKIK